MSPPTPSTSVSDSQNTTAARSGATSALAMSGLLKVQRRWSLTASATVAAGTDEDRDTLRRLEADGRQRDLLGPRWSRRSRLPVHIEDSEWSRLALGIAADALARLGKAGKPDVVQLGPDWVTVHVPTPIVAPWPFRPGPIAQSWALARDGELIGSLPVTPAMTAAARNAALVTLFEQDGRRTLVDLCALGSTILKGAPTEVGVKLADFAVELGTRRWSDIERLVLVAFDQPMPQLQGARHARDLAAALDEVRSRTTNASSTGSPSTCVIVPPWASDPADPLLGELVRLCEQTPDVGLLCCASAYGTLCLWELVSEPEGEPMLIFGSGRQIRGSDLADIPRESEAAHPGLPRNKKPQVPSEGRLEVAVLGNVQVNGAAESFRHRRRLTELVAFLAMHPEGATTDTFAAALWPERRVPVQTLANRLSETRKALGLANDGRPRLRKAGRRHLIAEAETDWDRFRDMADEKRGPNSWRSALALVRGRPFDGLERGGWAQLEGFSAAIEASVVDVACRLGDDALVRGEPGLAHWAALQGLLASPWDERLYRLLMRAADGQGNRGGIDAALRSLAAALEIEGDPLLGIHPETSALYRKLTSSSRV